MSVLPAGNGLVRGHLEAFPYLAADVPVCKAEQRTAQVDDVVEAPPPGHDANGIKGHCTQHTIPDGQRQKRQENDAFGQDEHSRRRVSETDPGLIVFSPVLAPQRRNHSRKPRVRKGTCCHCKASIHGATCAQAADTPDVAAGDIEASKLGRGTPTDCPDEMRGQS